MDQARKPLYVRVRVQPVLSETQLAALLWDALREEDECPPPVEVHTLSMARAKALIRDRLERHGWQSVECGPQDAYGYTDATERACVAVVRKVFGEGV
jgi:hypothetical protein